MMPPEPTQDPSEEQLQAPNLNIGAIGVNESDSEDEDPGLNGYMPLSQVAVDSDPMLDDDEDDDWISAPPDMNYALRSETEVSERQSCEPDVMEVWSSPSSHSDIKLDADKISQVKSAMASITLPNTAFPEWANNVSEDQWKQQLMNKIKEMQRRDN